VEGSSGTMSAKLDELMKHYDLIAGEYDERYHSGIEAKIRNQIIFSTLESMFLGKPKRILDVAGGTGFYSIPFAKRGHMVVILDISPRMLNKAIENARKNDVLQRVNIVQGSMDQLCFHDGCFDAILCHLAFGYAEPLKTLREFVRVLVKGGILSLTVANKGFHIIREALRADFSEAQRILQTEIFLQSPAGIPLIRTFTKEEIVSFCVAAGFKVLVIKGVRIISDYLPELPKDTEILESLEMRLSELLDCVPLSRHIHVVCKKN